MQIQLAAPALVAFLLAFTRAAAWVAVVPPLNTRTVPVVAKLGIAGGIALVVSPRTAAHAPSMETGPFVGALVIEVMAGLGLGFLVQLLFGAVQAAGSMIDLFGGFTMAAAYDPLSLNQASVFGRLYSLLATTLLFALDGHVVLVRGFLRSYDVSTAPTARGVAAVATEGAGRYLLAGIEMAAPLLAALFLSDVVLGLLTRSAPQLNAFQLGFPLKILLTLLLATFALPLLPESVRSIVDTSVRSMGLLWR